jgi:hypothetical protein
MRISVEDLVATSVNLEDEQTSKLKLKYWVGQVAALFEDKKGEKQFIMRNFDQSSQWYYMNSEDQRLQRVFGKSFRKYEVLESDVCDENSVDIIEKKLNWFETEEQAVIDNEGVTSHDIPNGLFSDRMVIRCGADGIRRDDLSDSLWPAPIHRRRNRLLTQCPEAVYSLRADTSSTPIITPTNKTVVGIPESTYQRAVESLKLSVLPEHLPCREEETSRIREFIKTAIKTTGQSGNVLYISGVPGTGKTASVLSVVNDLKKKGKEKFEFAYINIMK